MREMDEQADHADWLAEKRNGQCQCHFEMPGSCPGPANCPMCQPEKAFSHWECVYCGQEASELWRSCCGEIHYQPVDEDGEVLPEPEKYR